MLYDSTLIELDGIIRKPILLDDLFYLSSTTKGSPAIKNNPPTAKGPTNIPWKAPYLIQQLYSRNSSNSSSRPA
jgi:hypothetical protein